MVEWQQTKQLAAAILLVIFVFAERTSAHRQPSKALDRTPESRDAESVGVGRVVENIQIITIDGKTISFDGLLQGRRGLVVAMTSAECPIAKKYAPRIVALEKMFEGKVSFLYINPVDAELAEAIRLANRNSGVRGPYATDQLGVARRALKPSTTTEVFVLDPGRVVVYRGAVDDQFRIGGAAKEARRNFLREAIEAVIEGKAPEVRATAAPGCLVDMPREKAELIPPGTGPEKSPRAQTYFPDVARIVEANCMECHRLGGQAPFSLETPSAIEGRAAMIAAVVREGLMPPTHGLRSGVSGALVNNRTMREEDREALVSWLESAREIGAAPTTKKPDASNTWTIGLPDLILTTPGPTLPADGPMQYGRYLVPVNIEGDRWVTAVECRTVMHDTVDHALIWIVPPGGNIPRSGQVPPAQELLTTYSRSESIRRYAEGSARKLPAGSLLVADLFARPLGKPTIAQLRIAFAFAPAPPSREIRSMLVSAGEFELPAGARGQKVLAEKTLQEDAKLNAVHPYMGPRGRELVLEAVMHEGQPGARTIALLDLGRYDWRWQFRYELKESMVLPAGTRLVVRGVFDNSEENLANPDAEKKVPMGMGIDLEAMVVAFEFE